MSGSEQSHNDKPISEPSEDRFGIDPFAKTLAASIRKMKAPEGTVVALNGPWGSGKSSAVNLILHHLRRRGRADHSSNLSPFLRESSPESCGDPMHDTSKAPCDNPQQRQWNENEAPSHGTQFPVSRANHGTERPRHADQAADQCL